MNDKFYQIKDPFIDKLSVTTTEYFNQFIEKKDDFYLKEALKTIKSAISDLKAKKKTNEIINPNDLAYCYRKYATIIVRDKSNNQRNNKAKEILFKALEHYNDSYIEKRIITLEKQRALHQLRKLAYDLKDGKLLEDAVEQLMVTLQQCENTPYLIDCYESLSDLAFAKHAFKNAIVSIKKGLELCEPTSPNTASIRKLNTKNHLTQMKFFHQLNELNFLSDMKYTLYRLQAKIYLAELELKSARMCKLEITECIIQIEEAIWSAYNGHISGLNFARQKSPVSQKKYKQQLQKDLIFLFCLICKKCLLNYDNCDPLQCVLNQAKMVYGSEEEYHYIALKNILHEKIASIHQNHCLILENQLFKSETPIVIHISEEEIQRLFSQTHENSVSSNSN